MKHEKRVFLMAFLAGLPGTFIALILLWTGGYSAKLQWTLVLFVACFWLGFAAAVKHRVVYPLQTLSNLLAALREGDFSIRARGARRDDALGEVFREVNALGSVLREQRLGAVEATHLLRAVITEIDVAVFAFDNNPQLRLVNRAGERLLARPSEQLLGYTAAELGLADCLEGEAHRTLQRSFPSKDGRWGLRRSVFWERGLPHQLIVISDLSHALREEERHAWQRLVRVIGHELNNSLAPIKSMATTLESLLRREPRPPDLYDDLRSGLSVIAARAEALTRFMEGYTLLARLPQPRLQPVDIAALIQRVAGLEMRLKVSIVPGPLVILQADPDQLEQLLINLLRNAVDAALETNGAVQIGWKDRGAQLEISIEDEGPGLANTTNLFVPFFTTKPGGSGIGLVLGRQIAEAHGGDLTLENRRGGLGCRACLRLPLVAAGL